MIIPRKPSKSHIATLLFADFRRFNTQSEDIRTMLEQNGLTPYMYDRKTYTNVPFKSVIPNNIWRDTYIKANAETDPEMVFYFFAHNNGNPVLVVCSPVESINRRYNSDTGTYEEKHEELWKCNTYVRGCSTHGYEDSIEKILAKCNKH